MMIQIQYNFYPDAISFELKKIVLEHGQETVLAIHGGVGGVGSAGDENLEESICLGDGLYSFSLYDSSGIGFYSEYSLTLLPGETIVKRDNSKSLYGERVKFRLPFDRATLDVRWIGSDGQLLTLAPTDNPTASNKPTLRPTNYPTTSNKPTLRTISTPWPTFPGNLGFGTPVSNTPFPTEGTPSPTV